MKSKHDEVKELLGIDAVNVTLRIPGALEKRIRELGYKKYGTRADADVLRRGLLYSCALGVIEWARAAGERRRAPKNGKVIQTKSKR